MIAAPHLRIGGLTRFSTVDYPEHIAAVVFCQGCPWRCIYCHNTHLQAIDAETALTWQEILEWLDSRHGLLEAVVFSGGEPLLQRALAGAMHQVRTLGYRVALHTAGIYPERLAGVLPLVDWIGFDIKAPFGDYPRITQAKSDIAAMRSLSFVLASGKAHEIRCTVDETRLGVNDAARMAEQLAQLGVSRLVLQEKRSADGRSTPISSPFVEAMKPWLTEVVLRSV